MGAPSLIASEGAPDRFLLMLDEAELFGQFHDHHRDQGQAQALKVQRAGQSDQFKEDAHRSEEDQGDQRRREQAGPVQLAVGEGADAEQGVLRAHIEGLDDLGQGQHHKGHRLAAGQGAGGVLPQGEGEQGQ